MTSGDRCSVCGHLGCSKEHSRGEDSSVPAHLQPGGASRNTAKGGASKRAVAVASKRAVAVASSPVPELAPAAEAPAEAPRGEDRPRCGKRFTRKGKQRRCSRWKWSESPGGLCYSHEMELRNRNKAAKPRQDAPPAPAGLRFPSLEPTIANLEQAQVDNSERLKVARQRVEDLVEHGGRLEEALAALRALLPADS